MQASKQARWRSRGRREAAVVRVLDRPIDLHRSKETTMALTDQALIVLLQLLLIVALGMRQTSCAFHLEISPLSKSKGPMKLENLSLATAEASPSIVPSGASAWLWGSVSSADVGTVCEQVLTSGNLSFGITLTDRTLGLQKELHIQIKRLEGCQRSTDHAGTQALLIDHTGQERIIICPTNTGNGGCRVYMLTSEFDGSNFKTNGRRELVKINLCFPGDAKVYMANGDVRNMDELSLGDKVAVWDADGTITYEEIYAFGHKDATTIANFLSVTLASMQGKASTGREFKYIELTTRHFVPILSGIGGEEIIYKRGEDIKVGDIMLASSQSAHRLASTGAAGLAPYAVTDISNTVKQGLFNPYTMSGTIVVNGVVASSHSDWFLDNLFDKLGCTRFLPATYQAILIIPRILYKILGKKLYIATYTWLDLYTHQGGGAPSMWVACAIGSSISILLLARHKEKST